MYAWMKMLCSVAISSASEEAGKGDDLCPVHVPGLCHAKLQYIHSTILDVRPWGIPREQRTAGALLRTAAKAVE